MIDSWSSLKICTHSSVWIAPVASTRPGSQSRSSAILSSEHETSAYTTKVSIVPDQKHPVQIAYSDPPTLGNSSELISAKYAPYNPPPCLASRRRSAKVLLTATGHSRFPPRLLRSFDELSI
ncbi:hypothetical protein FRC08_011192 [Ceratobasidium sp. 394]|nr:hypothetical protein FRC08_011192 [Ceratobasidium sp. 394]